MKVIIAVDGSSCSMSALDFIAARPWLEDDEFFVIGVVELMPRDIGIGHVSSSQSMNDSKTIEVTELVRDCVKKIQSDLPRNKVEEVVCHGAIVDEICDLAKKIGAGLIVMGSHSRKGLEHFFLGSVAEAVAKRATCCVEIIKGDVSKFVSPPEKV